MARNALITKNFLSLGSVQGINALLQLLVIPYVIKIVGTENFGVIAVAQVLMFLLSTFTEYGFNQTATRNIAISGEDRRELSLLFSRVYFTRIYLLCFAFIILLILVGIVPLFRAHSFLYLTGFAFVAGQCLQLNWYFQGLQKMWFISIFTLLARIIFVVLVFALLRNKEGSYLFLFLLGFGSIITGVASAIYVRRKHHIQFILPTTKDVWLELKSGWPFTLTNLSMNICQYASVFILRLFTNDLTAGYYSIAERIYFTIKQILVSYSQSAYPAICTLVHEKKERLTGFFKANYLPFLIATVIGSILLIVLARPILYFFNGSEGVYSVFFLRCFAIAVIIICLNIPYTLLLLALNERKRYFRIYMLGGIINILANIILANYFQATGTITAIYITELFITAGVMYEAKQAVNIDG